ncbi:MAG TPA: hypothetical protein VF163_11240 [Micromonosporaceae bacterium]
MVLGLAVPSGASRFPQSRGESRAVMVIRLLHKILESGQYARLDEVYHADAIFDINVPTWRFKRVGPAAIRAQWAEWTREGPIRLVRWHERATAWGSVIEMAFQEGQQGTDYSRSLHVLTEAAGRINEHIMYCTGVWDQPTVERNRAEAPGMAEGT